MGFLKNFREKRQLNFEMSLMREELFHREQERRHLKGQNLKGLYFKDRRCLLDRCPFCGEALHWLDHYLSRTGPGGRQAYYEGYGCLNPGCQAEKFKYVWEFRSRETEKDSWDVVWRIA